MGTASLIGNPGIDTLPAYTATVDALVIDEPPADLSGARRSRVLLFQLARERQKQEAQERESERRGLHAGVPLGELLFAFGDIE